jgi:hypothetical protein
VLENSGNEVVGSFLNIPSMYHLDGEELICANGSRWAVQPEYRGYAAWLMDEHFNQSGVDLLVNTTVGPTATSVVSTFAERVPLGDWALRALRIIRYREFATRVLEMKRLPGARFAGPCAAFGLRLKDAAATTPLPALPPSTVGERLAHFDSRFDPFWDTLGRHNRQRLLAVRDWPTLNWHYGAPIRSGLIQIYTASRNGNLLAYCVLKEHSFAQLELRGLQIVDYQSIADETDYLPGLLRMALSGSGTPGVDILENLCLGLPEMRAFEHFASARYRRPSWSFYYQAPAPDLRARLRAPEVWCPSGYDGDTCYF